jgi:Flp pilus assembly secretin CpaC
MLDATPVGLITTVLRAPALARGVQCTAGQADSRGKPRAPRRSPSPELPFFGKSSGETTVYATDRSGRVVYAANVRVGTNAGSVGEMLRMAMPEASIQATPMNNLVLLTGTVAQPADVEEAQRLVQAYVGTGTQVVSRIRSATLRSRSKSRHRLAWRGTAAMTTCFPAV